MMKFDSTHAFLNEDILAYQPEVSRIHQMITDRSGAGSDFLGWSKWAENYDREEFARVKALAAKWKGHFDVLVVCGIGGSYLGARAAIEMIRGLYPEDGPEVIFAGNTFSASYTSQVLRHLRGKSVLLNVISKSGTTTETALAFRFFRNFMEDTYGTDGAHERIFATTDKSRGTLKELSDRAGYETFVIPDDIGGRYSVMTAVGLLPMALAGIDIDAAMAGFAEAAADLDTPDLTANSAYRYAVARRILDKEGYTAEMFVTYEPQLNMLSEWWKQLLGESEGKEGKGILPDSATFTTDLHSLGQFIQEGRKILFETVLRIEDTGAAAIVPADAEDSDKMNYLAGRDMKWIGERAFEGTLEAHEKTGHVPNLVITASDLTAHSFGYLAYWFFASAAMTCYMLGINPFNQPGVEVYKKNMFRLLGKPGAQK